MRLFFAAALLSGLSSAFVYGTPSRPAGATITLFDLKDATLLEGPFKHAQELDRAYVLAHDVDRLLAPFRTAAGLEPKAEKYPNWESTGLDGHTAGHYLTALAQLSAAGDDPEIRRRLDAMVAGLAECQAASGNGYVGGVPGGPALWRAVAEGKLQVEGFAINGAWVPWYNLHKTFAGLRDAWLIADHAQARDVLVRLADWCDTLVAGLNDEQMQRMLRSEHGGMNEVLADVYAITDERRFLLLAERFSHRAILEPLVKGEDRLDGLHANTQIPKVIGFARIAELGGDARGIQAARYFWDNVVSRRSVAFGGNSVREHFNSPDDFGPVLESREGPETCNTYNMLRLSEQLFRLSPEAKYADYYERALFNHILSSQHPEHGGFVYFTPIRPQHYRVYSKPEVCFWCCVGSGMESHSKQSRFIYAHTHDDLYVNLFVPSALEWRARGLSLRQETSFPAESSTRLLFSLEKPQRFSLRVRHPRWASAKSFAVRVNGEPWPTQSAPSSYGAIDREWSDGDRVEITVPMETWLEPLPDGSDYVAILHGPILLAAKTSEENLDGLIADAGRSSHIAPGKYEPLARAPMLVGEPGGLAPLIRPIPGRTLAFSAEALIRPEHFRELELVPFSQLHDARVMTYWRTVSPAAYDQVVAKLREEEAATLALAARTKDQISPGEQQSEVDHQYRGDDSRTGTHLGRKWRDASGSFGYDVRTGGAKELELRVTYFGGERDRQFEILWQGRRLADVSLTGGQPDEFVDVSYAVPASLLADLEGDKARVEFVAKNGSRAGAVYDIRVLSPAATP